MAPLVVFDDAHGGLGPLVDLRASFEVRTGALTNLERIERTLGVRAAALAPAAGVRGIVAARHAAPAVSGPEGAEALFVNGRCVLPGAEIASLKPGEALVEAGTGDLVAAAGSGADCAAALRDGLAGSGLAMHPSKGHCLIRRPWDVVRFRDEALRRDLAMLSVERWAGAPGVVCFGSHAVSVDAGAKVQPGVVIDAEHGAVRIEAGAVVRPGAILCGPCWIGPGSTVVERAHIKGGTAIGPVCKVGGEVGGTIFQGWSNKGHEGHLGDAWVGEWVNFGAGTTNSNLLNTYGEVVSRVEATASNERTGLTFFGCVVGDHAKFAILTRLMTGAVVGTGAMWAATAPVSGAVERFAWSTDAGRKSFRFDKFLETARAMMGRRKIDPAPAYIERLRELHAMGAGS
ncbi:MAG: hypothetical protein IBJ10_02690 [Phycisphaerales bacterium]|nr:hypothetical protein [Phycisphaerales bacterium]